MTSPLIDAADLATEIASLPPLSTSLLRLTEIVSTDNYLLQEVEEIIALDQALSLDTLRFANSAESGAARRIGSIREALVRMGATRVSQYLFSHWLRSSVKHPLRTYGISQNDFWRHGVLVGLAFAELRESELPDPSDFTIGMLHDIGKVALNHLAVRLQIDIDWGKMPDGPELIQAERDLFGMAHGEIGAAILDHWKFPQHQIDIARAIDSNTFMNSRLGKAHLMEQWVREQYTEKQTSTPMDLQGIPIERAAKVMMEYQAICTAIDGT